MKNIIFKIYSSFRIFFHIGKKNQNNWVLNSSGNNYFNYNSKYLAIFLSENHPEINTYYVINDPNLRETLNNTYPQISFISANSFSGIERIASCGVWITSAGLPIRGWKLNRKRLIVNLWHGVPLKRILLMENNYSFFKRVVFKQLVSKNYDYIMTPSSKLVPIMSRSFNVSESKVKVLGQPRNDDIAKPAKGIFRNEGHNWDDATKHILYAPTFRDEYKTDLFPFDDFDLVTINKFLEVNNIVIHLRVHQNEGDVVSAFLGDRIVELSNSKVGDITSSLNEFDLLITDYSSIYIDFLITQKPLLFLPYDREKYLENRGLNFDYDTVTPGPKPQTFNRFSTDLTKLINDPNYYAEDRKRTNIFFNEISQESSARIVDFIKANYK